MATLIKTNGKKRQIEPRNGSDFSLEELQKYVNGYIQIINLNNGQILVVNEEGKFTEEENKAATSIAQEHEVLFFGDYIAGDVVLCKTEEVK